MIDLNNKEEIKKLDPKDVFGSTEQFFKQCQQILLEGKVTFPAEYSSVKNIVICGMGGSAYGGYVTQALFKNDLKIPLVSNNDYHLPSFADENTLVILSSYSGSTEEVLSCAKEAYLNKCKVTGLTTGGKLAELLASENSPFLKINPTYNPSGQPRLGTGYMVLGFILLLVSLGLLSLSDEEVEKAIGQASAQEENVKASAQNLAKNLLGRIPVIMAAEFLSGNAHILRNQLNETAKSFSTSEIIPELNHHLMEGLKNPQDHKLFVLFLLSDLYSEKNRMRMELTKEVVMKNTVPVVEFSPSGSSPIAQVLCLLSFGGYLSLYAGLLYGQDPSLIPWVDYFKGKLQQQ